MTFPWNCRMCPKSSLNNSPTLMLYKLVGSGMKEKLSMCGFMDSPWREYRSRESPAGMVVEVLGIRILHLANLQCGRRRMTFMSGSGRSRNYSLCGEKKKPTGLYFLVWSWSKKLESLHVIAGLDRQMPLRVFWRQIPCVVEADAFRCGGKCLWVHG